MEGTLFLLQSNMGALAIKAKHEIKSYVPLQVKRASHANLLVVVIGHTSQVHDRPNGCIYWICYIFQREPI